MKKIDQLDAFINVVEQQSITVAATKLHLTSSAISQKITALEERLKVSLFNRSGKTFELTEPGKRLYRCAKKIMHEIYNAEAIMSQLHENPEGELRIYAPLANYFSEELSEFITLHPKITLKLDIAERIPNFTFENLDLVFGYTSESIKFFPENTVKRTIGTSRYLYCASPEYLAKYGNPKTLEDLHSHSFIVHSARPHYDILEFKDPKNNTKITPTCLVNDSQLMVTSALNNLGIIRMYYFMVEKYIADGRLIEILPHIAPPDLELALFYPYTKNVKPSLRCFIDFMLQKLQDWPSQVNF